MECPNCRGSGEISVKEICSVCDGAGKLVIIDDYGNKRVVACFTCRGSGRVEDTDTCPMCGGSGEV